MTDKDDAPELTSEMLDRAHFAKGNIVVKQGQGDIPQGMRALNWIPIEVSSNLEGYARDELTGNVYVQFKNGSTYSYEKVDKHIWEAFQASDSKGKFLNTDIKPFFAYSKVG
jgi:hypothetical protein